MAHEIETNDRGLFIGNKPWHGIGEVRAAGTIVTPREAVRVALPWEPEAVPLLRSDTNALVGHKAIVRNDDRSLLGVVSDDYTIIRNETLGRMAEYIGGVGCHIETAGSFRGGKRVWLLLRDMGSDWETVPGDPNKGYVMVTSGHDGTLALTTTPTTVRVVCANTHTLALAQGSRSTRASWWAHNGTVDEAAMFAATKDAILGVRKQTRDFALSAQALAARKMTAAQVQAFFTDVYAVQVGAIPANPTTEKECAAKADAVTTIARWCDLMDHRNNRIKGMEGSAWAATNAITQWACHDRRTRGDRTTQNMLGGGATFVRRVLSQAEKLLAV